MNGIILLNSWAEKWAHYMLHSAVESFVVLLLISFLWFVIRNKASVHLGYFLFLLVLIKLMIPFEITVPGKIRYVSPQHTISEAMQWTSDRMQSQPVSFEINSNSDNFTSSMAIPLNPSGNSQYSSLPSLNTPATVSNPAPSKKVVLTAKAWFMLSWGLATLFLFLWLSRIQIITHAIMQSSKPVKRDSLLQYWKMLKQQAKVNATIPLLENHEIPSPMVWGIVHPKVIIPQDFSEMLSSTQIEWVLLHELGHIRRMDIPVKLFQRIMQILFFWNPVIWVANWMIDQLREYACDDFALTISKASREECGEGLLQIVERTAMVPEQITQGLGLLDTKSYLIKRLRRIMDQKRRVQKSLSMSAAILLILAAIFTLPNIRAEQDSSSNDIHKTTVAVKKVPPPTGPMLSGVITDVSSGQPIPGAIVKLIQPGRGIYNTDDYDSKDTIIIESITNQAGQYEFNNIPNEGQYRITAHADGHTDYDPRTIDANNFIRIDEPHRGQIYNITLQQGYYAQIKIINEDGKPIEGAIVSAIVNEMRPCIPKAITNSAGECSFRTLKNKNSRFVIEKEGYGSIATEDYMPGNVDQPTQISITGRKPGSFSGIAKFEDGTPAKNIKLCTKIPFKAESTLINTPELPAIEVQSEENGYFTFSNLGAGTYSIFMDFIRDLDKPALYLKEQPSIALKESEHKDNIQLTVVRPQKLNTITGKVITSEGNPIVDAKIELLNPHQRFGKSDSQGNFVISSDENWQEGEFKVTANNYMKYQKKHKNSENPIIITMQQAGQIAGYVFDNDGNPLPNATVSIVIDKSISGWWEMFTDFALPTSTISGYDGSYSIKNLNKGIIDVAAETSGYEKKIVKNVEIISGKTTSIDFQMSKGNTVNGTITDSQGKLISNAVLGLLSKVKNNSKNGIGFSEPTVLQDTVQSKFDGSFSLDGISDKGDEIIIQHPDYAPARIKYDPRKNSNTPLKIILTSGGRIEGTFLDGDSKPIPGINVQAFNYPENLFTFHSITNQDGYYYFDHLPETEFIIRKQYTMNSSRTNVLVKEGETKNVSFGFGIGTNITGTLYENNQPLAKTKVTIQKKYDGYDEDITFTDTDEQGNYSFKGVPPGDWIFSFSTPQKNTKELDLVPIDHFQKVVIPQKVDEMKVDLYPYSYPLTIIVTDKDTGKPLPGVFISTVQDQSNDLPAQFKLSGKTDENGKAYFPTKAPLTYNLISKKDGYEPLFFPVAIPPVEAGKFVSAVTKEITMSLSNTSIEVNLLYNGKPWTEKVLPFVFKDNNRYDVEIKPVENKIGNYTIKKSPAGSIILCIRSSIPQNDTNSLLFMTPPEMLELQNDKPVNLKMSFQQIDIFQIRFKTSNHSIYEGPVTFEIPSYPQFEWIHQGISTKPYGAHLLIPSGRYPVKAIAPGYKPLEFTPISNGRDPNRSNLIYLEFEKE